VMASSSVSLGASPRRPSRIASPAYARRCCKQASPNKMPVANCLSAFELFVVLLSSRLGVVVDPDREM